MKQLRRALWLGVFPSSLAVLLFLSVGVFVKAATWVPLGTQPLRVITTLNPALNAQAFGASGTSNTHAFRIPVQIGQDAKSIVFSFSNWGTTNGGDVGNLNDVTIIDAGIDNGTCVIPVTFSGNAGIVIKNWANDIHSDPALPATCSLTKFARAEVYFLKGKVSVPATTGKFPGAQMSPGGSVAGLQSYLYDPAVSSVTSTYNPGLYTVIGTAPGTPSFHYTPIVLGVPIVDQASFFTLGDSIACGQGDTTTSSLLSSGGFIQRATVESDGVSNPIPMMNFCLSGNSTGSWTGTSNRWAQFLKYANVAINELGTNDIGISNAIAFTTLTQNQLQIAQLFRQGGIKRIIRPQLLDRTSDPLSLFLNAANQTIIAGWDVGQNAPNLNAWMATKLLDGTFQSVPSMDVIRDLTTPRKWLTNGTTYTPNVTVISGQNSFTFSTGTFAAGDIGKTITIAGAGAAGATLATTITAVGSSTAITTAANAGTSLSAIAEQVVYGTANLTTFDGTHPSSTGAALMATVLRAVLLSVSNTQPTPSTLPPVLNPNDNNSTNIISNSNLTVTGTVASGSEVRATTPILEGQKKYYEITVNAGTNVSALLMTLSGALNACNNPNCLTYNNNGVSFFNGQLVPAGAAFTTGSIVRIAVNAVTYNFAAAIGCGGNWNNNVANDPDKFGLNIGLFATGSTAGGGSGFNGSLVAIYPAIGVNAISAAATINFSSPACTVPAGYSLITGGGL